MDLATSYSPHLWGGLMQSIADMAVDDMASLVQYDQGLNRLQQLENAKTPDEVFGILDLFSTTERNRLNSPLLDLLFTLHPKSDASYIAKNEAAVNARMDHLSFVLDRKLITVTSVLPYACRSGNKDLATWLIDGGADVHSINDYALRQASVKGHKDVVELLLDRGADVHALDDWALRFACREGHRDVVELLLDRGADVRADDDGPVEGALAHNHTDVMALLIDRGAYFFTYDDAPLRIAAEHGQYEMVELLLDEGADLHTYDDEALREAASNGHKDVVELLLAAGCDSEARSQVQRSSLSLS